MRKKEQGQQLKQMEVKTEVGTEGSWTLCFAFLFAFVSLGFLLPENAYE